jgi:hypothetical protein
LSKKYPKIVTAVVEDTPIKVLNEDGEEEEVPVRYEGKNPNGFEVDNLYRQSYGSFSQNQELMNPDQSI